MKIVVIGAGASGLFASILAKERYFNDEVVVIDKNNKVAKKMYATGNGKCNIANSNISEFSYNSKIATKLIEKFSIGNVINFYESHGIKVINENDLLYPSNLSSDTTILMLEEYAKKIGVKFILNAQVIDYTENLVILDGANGSLRYDRLIIATGACSGKNFGTDGSIYELLKKHNYEVSNLVPGLCPIKVKEDVNNISGIRVKGEVTAFFEDSSYSEKGEILFKDDGLSGIVIFNISSIIARKNQSNIKLSLNLFPEENQYSLLDMFAKLNLSKNNFMYGLFHKKFANYLLNRLNIRAKDFYSYDELQKIVNLVLNLKFNYVENYSFEHSQVTVGGVLIKEISTKFVSKKENNVYLIGEVLDVDGLCGGYNLMWALVSSAICIENLI